MTTISNMVSDILNSYYSDMSAKSTSADTNTDTANKTESSSLVGRYLESTPYEDLNAKTIFKKLSLDAGGDGKTLTKESLDAYIAKAKEDKVNISENELGGLTALQKDWDKIADGGDKVTYAKMSGYKDVLTSMAPDDTTGSDIDYRALTVDTTAKAYAYIMESALSFSVNKNSSTLSLNSLLNTFLSGTTDEKDDANSDIIAKLTNLIAESKSKSTIEMEA